MNNSNAHIFDSEKINSVFENVDPWVNRQNSPRQKSLKLQNSLSQNSPRQNSPKKRDNTVPLKALVRQIKKKVQL